MISDKVRPHHLGRKALLYVRQSSAASTSMSLIYCGSVRFRPDMRRRVAANSSSARRCS